MAFQRGFQDGDGNDCDQISDGCIQSDDCDQAEAWLQPSPEVLMVVLTLVMIVTEVLMVVTNLLIVVFKVMV